MDYDGLQLECEMNGMLRRFLLHGHGGRHGGRQFDSSSALHQLDGLLHFHLVIEGDELGLFGALACYQALLHVLLVEAVQPVRVRGEGKVNTREHASNTV